jgi:hypothetical protein
LNFIINSRRSDIDRELTSILLLRKPPQSLSETTLIFGTSAGLSLISPLK